MIIRGAIFDMDGLMFDTERLFLRAFDEAVTPRMGHPFPEEKLRQLIGRSDSRRLFPELFPGDSFEECFAIKRAWVADFVEKNGLPIKPGLFQLLDYLKVSGRPMAVASSSGTKLVRGYLERSGTAPYFSAVITGDMVERGKPEPDIFLRAAEALGLPPEACLVFEDSRNGLLAAHAAGIPCVIVPDLVDPTLEFSGMALAKFRDLAQAADFLAELDGKKQD